MDCFWRAKLNRFIEIEFIKCLYWATLNKKRTINIQIFKHILAFFAASDGIVIRKSRTKIYE